MGAEEGSIEATPLAVAGLDCAQVQSTCETFMSGSFEAAGECAPDGASAAMGGEEDETESAGGFASYGTPASDGPVNCVIAPGKSNFLVLFTMHHPPSIRTGGSRRPVLFGRRPTLRCVSGAQSLCYYG